MTNSEALIELKDLSNQLEQVEYDDIILILKDSIKRIPVPVAKLRIDTPIDRVRKNIGEQPFTNVHEQLSYIKDQHVIDTYMTEFGRANKPHQPMFYGAVESTLVGHQRITALAETSELFQDSSRTDFDGELYTVSRWRSNKELFLADMVFSQEAIQLNPDVKKAFEEQSEFAKQVGVDVDFYLDFLIFMSDQFARPKVTHHDYKISTAYTNLVIVSPDIDGVAYPSVQTKYQGQNIVFPPNVVDSSLVVDVLGMQRLFKNRKKAFLNNFKDCSYPSTCLTNISWNDTDAQYIASKDEIHKALIED